MNKLEALASLRTHFAALYDDIPDIRIVVADAGLAITQIDWQGSADRIWQAVLTEAHRQNLVARVVDLAGERFPEQAGLLRNDYRQYATVAEAQPTFARLSFEPETLPIPASEFTMGSRQAPAEWRAHRVMLVDGALAKFKAALTANPQLKLDLAAEEQAAHKQAATLLVQAGEVMAAKDDREGAATKFQAALDRNPPSDAPVYVWVEAGEFTMGSRDADPYVQDDEKPQHKVKLAGYWIMRTEVTNAQYKRCVEAGHIDPPGNNRYANPQVADWPVTDVDWTQASAYAAWVGGRLPSEAEWEKACRGGDARIWPWGNEPPTPELLNYAESDASWTDVGSHPKGASPYGLMDMAGNVWEWTSSRSENYPYKADDGREDQGDDDARTLRGGAFYLSVDLVRCAYRGRYVPTSRNLTVGFRVVSPGL